MRIWLDMIIRHMELEANERPRGLTFAMFLELASSGSVDVWWDTSRTLEEKYRKKTNYFQMQVGHCWIPLKTSSVVGRGDANPLLSDLVLKTGHLAVNNNSTALATMMTIGDLKNLSAIEAAVSALMPRCAHCQGMHLLAECPKLALERFLATKMGSLQALNRVQTYLYEEPLSVVADQSSSHLAKKGLPDLPQPFATKGMITTLVNELHVKSRMMVVAQNRALTSGPHNTCRPVTAEDPMTAFKWLLPTGEGKKYSGAKPYNRGFKSPYQQSNWKKGGKKYPK